jgi:hypothetical protein
MFNVFYEGTMGRTQTCNVSQVFLEGKRALQPVDWISEAQVTYYIGAVTSNIKVNDYRQKPNLHAIQSIQNQKERENFYQSFAQPAKVIIQEHGDNITIELNEPENEGDPILWLGVFDGDELAANPLDWYALRNTGDERTAFVALVNPQG